MKIIIVANSPKKSFKEMYHLNPSDYFIGLDGGAMELLERRIKPDIAIGDFDSTNFLQEIEKNAIETKIFPAKKNETDLELAFMYLKNIQGATNLNIEVYDALSGRLDHELVAIRLLAKYNEYKVKLIDKENTIELLKEKKVGVVNKNAKYFSIFPIGEATIIITKDVRQVLTYVETGEKEWATGLAREEESKKKEEGEGEAERGAVA